MSRGAHRLLLASALGAVLSLSAATAHADGRAELDKARAAYVARNWPEAEERVRALLDPTTGVKERALVSLARMYLGAVLLAQGKKEQATDIFEKLILEDPSFDPDPLSFPADVINTFIDTKSTLSERIKNAAATAAKLEAERRAREAAERQRQAEWLEKVKARAQEDKTTVRNNRLTAFLPFGIGQFQNEQPVLGWIFLGAESALVTATLVTIPMYAYQRAREREELASPNLEKKAEEYHNNAETIFAVNLSLVGAFVVVTTVGIVQANAAFVPERVEQKKRDLPPMGRLSPTAAPLVGAEGVHGGFIGIRGVTF
jgi:tetratricopeptide (TPR) repeat protein